VHGKFDGLARLLVGCHPPAWRRRYAAEVLAVLDQHEVTARTVLNLWVSAVSAQLDPAWRSRADLGPFWRHVRQAALGVAAVAGALTLIVGCMAWQDHEGNIGPPPQLSDGIFSITFSADGRTVALLNTNLEIWSVADPARPRRLGYSMGDTAGGPPAFSPDGRTLATGGNGGTGILWNVTDPTPRPAEIATLPDVHAAEGAFAFFPDGRTLATGYDNGTVVLWNIARPAHITRVSTLAIRADGPHGLSISPDGHLLAAASTTSPGTVALWDVADPARPARIAVLTGAAGQAGGISALSFSPDGHLLATASNNGTVVLRDVTRPAAPAVTATLRFTVPAWRFAGQATPPDVEFAFSADGRTLTAIAGTAQVTRWDVTNPDAVFLNSTISRDSLGAGAVAVAPGGRAVAGAPTAGDTLALWRLPQPG